jgi:hypothetical protein
VQVGPGKETEAEQISSRQRRTIETATTRTDRDWIMVVLGVLLIVAFLVAGYLSLGSTPKSPSTKPRGPVKNPARSSSMGHAPAPKERPHQTGLRISSLPFPDRVWIDRDRNITIMRRAMVARERNS